MRRAATLVTALMLAALVAWRLRPAPPPPPASEPAAVAPSVPADPFLGDSPAPVPVTPAAVAEDSSERVLFLPEPAEPRAEAKTAAALRWLARAQNADGSWGFGNEEFEGAAYSKQGATALALLAFFEAGYFHISKDEVEGVRIGEVIKNGLKWLIANPSQGAFDTTLTALAWCEGYGLTNSAILKEYAKRDLAAALTYQSADGSWSGDEATTGWAALVLRSARVSGLEVPDDAATRAFEFYERQMAAAAAPAAAAGWAVLRPGKGETPVDAAIAALHGRKPEWALGDVTWGFKSTTALISLAGYKGEAQESWKASLVEQARTWRESIPETRGDTGTASVVGNALRQLTLELFFTYGSLEHVDKRR